MGYPAGTGQKEIKQPVAHDRIGSDSGNPDRVKAGKSGRIPGVIQNLARKSPIFEISGVPLAYGSQGWHSRDIFPPRENPFGVFRNPSEKFWTWGFLGQRANAEYPEAFQFKPIGNLSLWGSPVTLRILFQG